MKVPFSSLSPQDALHVAILIEERNARLYEGFAQLFADFIDEECQKIAAIFGEMAAEERRHRHELEKRYVERYGIRLSSLVDEDVLDVIELPELNEEDLLDPESFSRVKALEVALAAELHARHYYARLSQLTHDPQLRQLYQELAAFEEEHVSFLEQKLKDLSE